jgi:hypothetical protein
MRPTPIQIAAGVALLGAGGVAGAALPVAAQRPAAVAAAPAPVEVRTQVVHRTVRIVRHERPKHLRPRRPAAAAPAPAPPPAAPPPAPAARVPAATAPATAAAGRPLVTRSSGTAAHRSAPSPLRTRSSSTGGRGGEGHEHEREGGGDD